MNFIAAQPRIARRPAYANLPEKLRTQALSLSFVVTIGPTMDDARGADKSIHRSRSFDHRRAEVSGFRERGEAIVRPYPFSETGPRVNLARFLNCLAAAPNRFGSRTTIRMCNHADVESRAEHGARKLWGRKKPTSSASTPGSRRFDEKIISICIAHPARYRIEEQPADDPSLASTLTVVAGDR